MLRASCTSTSVGGKRNNFFTVSAQFVESDPCGREIILLCRNLLPLIPSRSHSYEKNFQWIQERIQDRFFMFGFGVSSSHTTCTYPSLQVWRLDTGNRSDISCLETCLQQIHFVPLNDCWLLILQPICLDGTRPAYKVIFQFHFTSHPEMPANFGHSAQYLSCTHFGTKPC